MAMMISTKTKEVCNYIPFAVEKICQAEVLSIFPYPCIKQIPHDICKLQEYKVPTTCYRLVNKKKYFSCPNIVNEYELCHDVPISTPETCTRKKLTDYQKKCEKNVVDTVCFVVAKEIPSKCFIVEEKEISYECIDAKSSKSCSTEYRKIPSICKKEVIVQTIPKSLDDSPHDEVNGSQICENIIRKKNICHRTVYQDEEYDCNETIVKQTCKNVDTLVPVPCEMTVTETKVVDCTRKEKRVVEKSCFVEQFNYQPINDSGSDKSKTCGHPPELNDISYIIEDCNDKLELDIPQTCIVVERVPIPILCLRNNVTSFCMNEPMVVNKRCKKKIAKLEEFPCEDIATIHDRNCVTINNQDAESFYLNKLNKNNKGIVLEDETFRCEASEAIETCSLSWNFEKKQCKTTVLHTVEHQCFTNTLQQECRSITSSVPSTCTEVQYVDERYPCPKLDIKRHCERFPIYDNSGLCETTVQEVEEYECEESRFKVDCNVEMIDTELICYDEKKGLQEYTCFEMSKKKHCESYPLERQQLLVSSNPKSIPLFF